MAPQCPAPLWSNDASHPAEPPIHFFLCMNWKPRNPLRCLVLAGLGLEAIYVALLILGDWNAHIPIFLAFFFALFLIYLLLLKWLLDGSFESIPRLSMVFIGFAVVFRLTLFWSIPSLSEDFYRYIWDGRVQIAGINPYRYPPEGQELSALRDVGYERINHKNVRTPYPPFAEVLFHVLAKISPGLFTFKTGFLFFELLLIFMIYKLLLLENLPTSYLLIYAWHPLPIVEFAGSAHMDIVAISLFVTSYWFVYRSRGVAGGAVLAAAIFTKYIPMVSIPWLWKKGGWRLFLTMGIFSVILIARYYTPDLVVLKGIFAFYQKWWFNDSMFSILHKWMGGAEPARIFGGAAVLCTTIFCYFKHFSLYRSFLIIYGTVILFSPVVHPWYVCWMIPFFVFHRNWAWLFFSGWIVWSYLIRYLFPDGVWGHVLWLKLLVYVPLFLLLLISACRYFLSTRLPNKS